MSTSNTQCPTCGNVRSSDLGFLAYLPQFAGASFLIGACTGYYSVLGTLIGGALVVALIELLERRNKLQASGKGST